MFSMTIPLLVTAVEKLISLVPFFRKYYFDRLNSFMKFFL